VRDLVSLFGELESGQETRVVVLESADPHYFVPHVDLTKVAEYTAEAAKAGGPDDASLGMLWHFRGNLDNWDPALIDALASTRRVVTFDNAGVGGSSGTTPDTIEHMARDALTFIAVRPAGEPA
jgi:pimeloyl-ACP methyl ester carboxylesterase